MSARKNTADHCSTNIKMTTMKSAFSHHIQHLFLATLILLFCVPAIAQTEANGKCVKKKSVFSMSYTVTTNINATPEKVWSLLTNAGTLPQWNTTVNSIDGTIAEGEKIALVAAIAPERTFKLNIRNVEPNKQMKWKDGAMPMFRGVRTYTLTAKPDGTTDFTMTEKFKGLMFPMIKGVLPDFTQSFEDYARDLKLEAEK